MAAATPGLSDGVNWYCYTALGLLWLVDFTPIGQAVASGADAPIKLAVFQLATFFLPSLVYAWRMGWDFKATFRVAAPSGKWAAAGLGFGPVVWALTSAAISLRTGVWPWDAAPDAAAGAAGGLVGGLVAAAAAGTTQDAATLLASAALAPAVMEELLFRGLLLTALRQRFGSVDAAAVSGALFALIHLSVEQFFPFCVLGLAAGAVATASGSVWPAVALHAGYNATGLALGLALQRAAAG